MTSVERFAGSWVAAATVLHERVRVVAFDRVAVRLVELHAPVDRGGDQPVCEGCDQASVSDELAMWPCRTYTVIAACVLGLGPGGVEEELTALRALGVPQRTDRAVPDRVSTGAMVDDQAGDR
ncbi:MAG: hypothetical protein HY241_06965 [Actinobacteria bacterium]|nr:hypothetical protein [Actinomycetota bacterium]